MQFTYGDKWAFMGIYSDLSDYMWSHLISPHTEDYIMFFCSTDTTDTSVRNRVNVSQRQTLLLQSVNRSEGCKPETDRV